jgi:TonB family protein
MTTMELRIDHEGVARTRWSMTLSAVFHALLMLWIVTLKTATAKLPEMTEITLIDPGELSAPAASAAAPAGPTVAGALHAQSREERFSRELNRASVEPEPQSTTAIADRISARLASMQEQAPLTVAGTAGAGVPSNAWGPATAVSGTGAGGSGPALSMNRGGGTGTGPALTLTRGGTGTSLGPASISTGLPKQAAEEVAPAQGGESTARRNLAGATLMGPIADRAVITYATPNYPDWAKRDAVEGSVTLYFVVRPDGSVKENVLIQKTAGFEDFDENARVALRAWKFEPLHGGRTGEQWGTITFHYRIREAG